MTKYQEEIIEYIKSELLAEAVYNRCFCETGSREFVEYDSSLVEPLKFKKTKDDSKEYYRARLIVNFSGEPKSFSLMIKLLRIVDGNDRIYDGFLNEEMFYNKMTKKYDLNIYPVCYVADMGRYGSPVIVLEDLEACGYVRVDSKLDKHHLDLCLKAIARFHQRGFALKATNFNSFREFYAKLIDTRLDKESSNVLNFDLSNRILSTLKKLQYRGIDTDDNDELRTICHGNLGSREHLYFKYENKMPVDVKIIGWNSMRYCSIVEDLADIFHDSISSDDDIERYLSVYIEADK